jgi:hypothetical protein
MAKFHETKAALSAAPIITLFVAVYFLHACAVPLDQLNDATSNMSPAVASSSDGSPAPPPLQEDEFNAPDSAILGPVHDRWISRHKSNYTAAAGSPARVMDLEPGLAELAVPHQDQAAATAASASSVTWAQFCAKPDVKVYCSRISGMPELAQYFDGSQPWPFNEPATFLVPTDAAWRAAENQVSSDVRKMSPLLQQLQQTLFFSTGIYTPTPMANNRSATVFQTWLDGDDGQITYLKTGSRSWMDSKNDSPKPQGQHLVYQHAPKW